MASGTAFRLTMGFVMLTITIIVWLPLNDITQDVETTFNTIVPDSDNVSRNAIVTDVFETIILIELLVWGIWVVKSATEERRRAKLGL